MQPLDYVHYIVALIFVVSLIFLVGYLLQKYQGQMKLPFLAGRRLKVQEQLVLDGQRRLLLVRHDQHEHLILLGPRNDAVVVSNLPATTPPPEPNSKASS